MVKLAGQALQKILGSRMGQVMTAPATKDVLKASAPGAALSTGFSLMAGAGVPASVATGALDLGLSTVAGRLAGNVTPAMLNKVMPKKAANFLADAQPGQMSVLQNVGMGAGSIGAAVATYPMYAGSEIANLSQQELQQLMAEPVVMDQTATAEQQLLQRDLVNKLQAQSLSPGTMFQMQGVESTLGRGMTVAPNLDPYGIMRGGNIG